MKWEKVEIGKISKVISGYPFKSHDFKPEGTPIIKIKNIKDEHIVLNESDCVDSAIEVPIRFHLSKGDILISLTGSHITLPSSVVGRVAKYRHDTNSYLNQRAGKFINIDLEKCIKDYLFYFLIQKETLTRIALKAQGAANQANISPGDVEGIEINLPPLPTQRRIVSILSAYDDLIENNLKRIKLLEEKAQLHYKELIQNSVCWDKVRIEEFVSVVKGRKPANVLEQPEEDSLLYLLLDTVERSKTLWTTDLTLPLSKESDVLMCMDGARSGLVFRGMDGAIGSTMAIWRSNSDRVSGEFLFQFLKQNESAITQGNTGSAIPHANRKFIFDMKLLMPPKREIDFFNKMTNPLVNLIKTLYNQNAKLREARDILLPRLMNGEIVV
ncbi:MAG: restriction endonuclease subunit S [Mariniphaga sp.]